MLLYRKRSTQILIYVFIAAASFVLGWQAMRMGFLGEPSAENPTDISEVKDDGPANKVDLTLFWEVWKKIEDNYINKDAISYENMIYGAVKGFVNSLDDPYTVYMTPKESSEFSANLEGTLEGIGAELTVEDKNLVIVSPLKNSPAEKAGLLPRDIIFKIDNKLSSDMTLFDAIMAIRGKKGTTVTLTIIRKGLSDPFEVSIVRDSIDVESISVEKVEGDIVYLSVNQFNDKTKDQFGKAVSNMILHEPKGIIVDLRFNGGGYLDTAVDLLSYLLPSNSKAVIVKRRDVNDTETMYVNGNPKILNVPLVVLVNEGSASASEIVACAIQDYKRGVIMGMQTFGKGSVQEVESFSDGSSIRMTIAKWYSPNDRTIDKVGLTPDVIVKLEDADVANKFDRQKTEAINYLKNLK